MNLKNFIEGIDILKKYYTNLEGYHLGAEHDQIFLYQTNAPLSDEDVTLMKSLGWFQPDNGDDEVSYDDENGWSCFV